MAVDLIVVGAGSAGCVLAARLTAAGRRVLLIEAGPDHPSEADLPADVADASEPTLGHDWGFAAEPDGERGPVPLPRARLVGACGASPPRTRPGRCRTWRPQPDLRGGQHQQLPPPRPPVVTAPLRRQRGPVFVFNAVSGVRKPKPRPWTPNNSAAAALFRRGGARFWR